MAGNTSLPLVQQAGTYDSEFEFDSDAERQRRRYEDLSQKQRKAKPAKASKRLLEDEYNKEEGRIMRHGIISMNAFDRHKLLINNYLMYYGGDKAEFKRDTSQDKTDMDVIRENHRFLWTEEDDPDETWSKRLAKKYHDKLFKEYCISDLSRYKQNKVAMRWRIEREVEEGKGQFICGNKKCPENEGLRSWEVNFAYMEDDQKKNALVKLRLCADCSYKLNYHHRKKEIIPKKGKNKHTSDSDSTKKRKSDTADTRPSPEVKNQDRAPGAGEGTSTSGEPESSVWSGPVKIVEEKSRESEFDDYFADMLL